MRKLVSMLRSHIVLLALLVPVSAGAEHGCDDGYPDGRKVTRAAPFPNNWFLVGAADVSESSSHDLLRHRFKKEYVTGDDEGPTGAVCLRWPAEYVAVTRSEIGLGVQYSTTPPKCLECENGPVDRESFLSGAGLRLGQTKAQASKHLRTNVQADLTDITFEKAEVSAGKRIVRTEVLQLEFVSNKLVRFSVYEFREGD